MPLGKKQGRNPREVAVELVAALASPESGVTDVIEEPEIAGPGFINLRPGRSARIGRSRRWTTTASAWPGRIGPTR